MADLLVADAVFTGVKEAAMAGLAGLGAYHLFSVMGKKRLSGAFLSGLLGALVIGPFIVSMAPEGHNIRDTLTRLVAYEFVLLHLAAVLAIRHVSGSRLLPDGSPGRLPAPIVWGGIFLGGAFYLAPHAGAAFLFLREQAVLSESPAAVAVSAFTGVGIVIAAGAAFRRFFLSPRLAAFVWAPQFLLLLSLLLLVLGGTRGVAEYSLIPAVQTLVMKLVHDLVHHTFTILLVPDHPLLRTTTWRFIGFFFGPNFGMGVALALLLTPPIVFLGRLIGSPLPEGDAWWTGAERRLHLVGVMRERRKQALIVAGFVGTVLLVWFVRGADKSLDIHVPSPKPVVEDKGMVIIPLQDPTMDLKDGRIHKFALSHQDRVMRLLVAARPDGSLAVCLDACEICPPEGYGQKSATVICLYCNTPIPVESLGKPGGCNPIPLAAEVTQADIRIPVAEILARWKDVGRTPGGEAVR